MSYRAALAELPADDAKAIEDELNGWLDHAPVADNVRRETALPHGEFVRLLNSFVAQLPPVGSTGPELFDVVCRDHKLKGPEVGGIPPRALGRAVPLERLVEWFHAGNARITKLRWEQLVRRHAARPERLASLLGAAVPLGRYVIWSTFTNPHRNSQPFTDPLHTMENVRTALGLGEDPLEQPWVLLVYEVTGGSGSTIRKPTVADAGRYRYYSPVSDASKEEHGWTQPLPPNASAIDPQPEVVHAEALDHQVTQLTILE